MTNATAKSSFLATPKSDILCNTEVAKNAEISDCKNGRLPCCTSVLHKMPDFGVARQLDFVVALVIVADNSPLWFTGF